MPNSDILLRFVLSTDDSADMRTFRVLQVLDNATELELYKVCLSAIPTLYLDNAVFCSSRIR